jgi:hypothetical protein
MVPVGGVGLGNILNKRGSKIMNSKVSKEVNGCNTLLCGKA